jgi:hypothetical protein
MIKHHIFAFGRISAIGLSLALAIASVSSPAAAAPGDRAGVIAVARGAVTRVAYNVNRRGVGQNVTTGQNILLGDVIATGRQGRLQILLLDQTMFTIGPNSRMTIDEFVYNPRTSNGKVTATVTRGFCRFIAGKSAAKSPDRVKIRTPVATLSIRGTSIFGFIRPVQRAFLPGRKLAQSGGGQVVATFGLLGSSGLGEKPPSFSATSPDGKQSVTISKAGVAFNVNGAGAFQPPRKINIGNFNSLTRQVVQNGRGSGGGGAQGSASGGGQNPPSNGGQGGGSGGGGQPGGDGNAVAQSGASADTGIQGAGNTLQTLTTANINTSTSNNTAQTSGTISSGVTKFSQLLAITTGSISGTTITNLTAIQGSGTATNSATWTINFANRTRTLTTQGLTLTTPHLGALGAGPVRTFGPFSYANAPPNAEVIASGTFNAPLVDSARTTTFFNTPAGVARRFTTTLTLDDRNGNVLQGTSSADLK